MDKNKKQVMRYTDAELEIIKNTFVDNDELLKAIRKFMLQLPMTKADKSLLKSIQDKPEVLKVIRKSYLPTIDGDAPLNQIVDLWMTVEIKDKTPRDASLLIKARGYLINYLEQQLGELEGGEKGKLSVDEFKNFTAYNCDEDELYCQLIFRNTMISHSEMQMNMFQILAGWKEESVEQTKERLARNSAK
jgi:hypothetical protein